MSTRSKEISERFGLENLPLSLIEDFLPKVVDVVGESKRALRSNARAAGDGRGPQHSASGLNNALTPYEIPCPMEAPELLLAARLLESSPPAEQPESSPPVEEPEPLHAAESPASVPSELIEYSEWETIVDFPGWVPEIEPPTEEQQSPTHGELEVPLGQPNSSVVPEVDVEELPSAALECLLDVEHSQAVETGRSENQFGLPTREDIEKSLWTLPRDFTDLGDCADMGGVGMGDFARFDFGTLFDGWERFGEFGCPDEV